MIMANVKLCKIMSKYCNCLKKDYYLEDDKNIRKQAFLCGCL